MAQVNWQRIEQILGSRTAETAMNMVGAGLTAAANNRNAQQQLAQNQGQFEASQLANLAADQRADARTRATTALGATSLGDNEHYLLRSALLREMLPQVRNFSATPGDPAVAAAMGTMSGGMRLPEGGFSPAALASLSETAAANAIGRRQQQISNVDPNAPLPNLAAMGVNGDTAAQVSGDMTAYADTRAQQLTADQTRTMELLREALTRSQQQQQEKKKGSGFWGKVGTVMKVAAPIVLAATGVGLPAAMAITAGANLAGTKMQGGSWGDAVKSGAIGAGMAGVGGSVLGGARAGAGATNAARSTAAQTLLRGARPA